MEQKPLTVTQISTYFKQIFDAEELLFNVKVCGEISGLSIVRNVAYFTLKDENATMSCVCFDVCNFNYQNGDNVVVTGSPKYYVKGGKLNFNVNKIEKFGLGVLYQQFLELKNKLEQKGYFSDSHKIAMPKKIDRIGVVTSREGAVIQDIINVRTRRNPYIDIVLYPVKVQGIGAESEIAKGIKFLDNYNVDVIIVARGGGSLEDLSPFNTEVVADAIYNANKFIVSAVGHETDYTICDFCSDLRAPTPSAAAELICSNICDQIANLNKLTQKLQLSIKNYYTEKHTIFVDFLQKLLSLYKYKNLKYYNELKNHSIKLKHCLIKYLDDKSNYINLLNSKLTKLNPNEVLKLGYACIRKGGKNLSSVKNITVGDEIELQLKDGFVCAKATNVKGE